MAQAFAICVRRYFLLPVRRRGNLCRYYSKREISPRDINKILEQKQGQKITFNPICVSKCHSGKPFTGKGLEIYPYVRDYDTDRRVELPNDLQPDQRLVTYNLALEKLFSNVLNIKEHGFVRIVDSKDSSEGSLPIFALTAMLRFFANIDYHQRSLQTIKVKFHRLKEIDVTCILANHLIAPLVPVDGAQPNDVGCMVSSDGKSKPKICPCGQDYHEVVYGNTEFATEISSASSRRRFSANNMPDFRGDSLDRAIDNLWDFAIADSTKSMYSVGLDLYFKFILLQGYSTHTNTAVLPPFSEYLLMRFIAFCETQKHLRYSTIKSYLCGIRYFYLKRGGFNPLENIFGKPLSGINSILTGLKKKQANIPKRVHLPITFDILQKMCLLLQKGVFSFFTDILLESACIMAFFGFLRCGEFTVLEQFDPESNLCLDDVQLSNECVFISLKKSKTDPFRYGVTIPLFKNNSELCPVSAISKYLLRRKSIRCSSQSFFVTETGIPLSRSFFISHIKSLLDKIGLSSDKYNGHSFRSGAATSAHVARLEDHLIQTLGRWSSDCYTRHIHTSPEVLKQAQQQIVNSYDEQ